MVPADQGQRDGGSKSYDTPIQTKPTNNRQQTNNAHKKDKYDKTRMMEDGPRSKNGKVSKHLVHHAAEAG